MGDLKGLSYARVAVRRGPDAGEHLWHGRRYLPPIGKGSAQNCRDQVRCLSGLNIILSLRQVQVIFFLRFQIHQTKLH